MKELERFLVSLLILLAGTALAYFLGLFIYVELGNSRTPENITPIISLLVAISVFIATLFMADKYNYRES